MEQSQSNTRVLPLVTFAVGSSLNVSQKDIMYDVMTSVFVVPIHLDKSHFCWSAVTSICANIKILFLTTNLDALL